MSVLTQRAPKEHQTPLTLKRLFDPRNNALNAIRLFFACSVVLSHAWVIGGIGEEPSLGGRTVGAWAVLGFFGISGYLITRSRMNGQPAASYFRARFLRIYPGFLAALALVAFVFAPLAVALGSTGSFTFADSLMYVARNLFLYPPVISQHTIGTTLAEGEIWNGALWSLFWEACCYVGVGILGIAALGSGRKSLLLITFLAATGVSLAAETGIIPPSELTLAPPLVAAFTAGSLMFFYSHRIRVVPAAAIAAVLLLASIVSGTATVFAPLPFTLLVLVLGSVLPFRRVGAKRDLSYGIYIYGVPVQNLLEVWLPALVLPVYLLLTYAFVVPLALASFTWVEAPAMRLKRRVPSAPVRSAAA